MSQLKFQGPSSNTFGDTNFFLVIFGPVQTTDDRQQTESDAYEPTVQSAQVGSKNNLSAPNSGPVYNKQLISKVNKLQDRSTCNSALNRVLGLCEL